MHARNGQLVVEITDSIEISIVEVLEARRNTTEHGWELLNFFGILLQRILQHLADVWDDRQEVLSEIFFLLSTIAHIHQQFKDFLLGVIVKKVNHVERHCKYTLFQDIFRELLADFFTRLNALLDQVHVAHGLLHSLLNCTDDIDTH